MNKFEANLIEASRAELAITELLKRQGYNAWLNPKKNGDCDVYFISDRQYGVEVKTDFASMYTGNVAIEPQTLEHTKADYFAFVIPEVQFIATADVRNFYTDYMQTGKNGGDQNKRLALIPKDILLNRKD